jgi:hypothetical protein
MADKLSNSNPSGGQSRKSLWETLKDHPVFFVIGACAATAVATYGICDIFLIRPSEENWHANLEKTKGSPVITPFDITRRENSDGSISVEQRTFLKDPDGDAKFINQIILQTDSSDISLGTNSIDVEEKEQIKGSSLNYEWSCNGDSYYVKIRAVATDAAGNASAPQDYVVTCPPYDLHLPGETGRR